MGKASSAKKVARAARAGGKTSRTKRRQVGYPLLMGLIVVVGVAGVLVARSGNEADSTNRPKPGDHWHAAYGIYVCDHFVESVPGETEALGVHTHADGLIHVEPSSVVGAGRQANLGRFFDAAGLKVDGNRIRLPTTSPFNGRTYKSGSTTCNGKKAEVRLAEWTSGTAAAQGAKPTKVSSSDIRSTWIRSDLRAYTIAFVPPGTAIPPPPKAGQNESAAQGSEQQPVDTTPLTSVPPTSGSSPATGSAPATGSTASSAPAPTASSTP